MSDAAIARGLAEIRRRRTLFWVSGAAYLPLCATLFYGLDALGIGMEGRGGYVALPYLALFGWLGVRSARARCPRCGERFHGRWPRGDPFARACAHCRLPLTR